MVRIKKKRQPLVREIKPSIKILEPSKKRLETLEREIETEEALQEQSFIRERSEAPVLRQIALPTTSEGEKTVEPRVREVDRDAPVTYSARRDSEVYTSISAQNAGTRYTMHSETGTSGNSPRTQETTTPLVGSQHTTMGRERSLGQPTGLDTSASRMQSLDSGRSDRYDLYQEGSQQDDSRSRTRRR